MSVALSQFGQAYILVSIIEFMDEIGFFTCVNSDDSSEITSITDSCGIDAELLHELMAIMAQSGLVEIVEDGIGKKAERSVKWVSSAKIHWTDQRAFNVLLVRDLKQQVEMQTLIELINELEVFVEDSFGETYHKALYVRLMLTVCCSEYDSVEALIEQLESNEISGWLAMMTDKFRSTDCDPALPMLPSENELALLELFSKHLFKVDDNTSNSNLKTIVALYQNGSAGITCGGGLADSVFELAASLTPDKLNEVSTFLRVPLTENLGICDQGIQESIDEVFISTGLVNRDLTDNAELQENTHSLADIVEASAGDSGSTEASFAIYKTIQKSLKEISASVSEQQVVIAYPFCEKNKRDNTTVIPSDISNIIKTKCGVAKLSADTFLHLAGSQGLFADIPPSFKLNNSGIVEFGLYRFNKRYFTVRMAKLDDLDILEELEKQCWDEALQTPRNKLADRITHYPYGQVVLEYRGTVSGVIYSQRIDDEARLFYHNMDNVHELHNANGSIVQLLAINIRPDIQNMGCGDQLLEFMLQRSTQQQGVGKIVAVTLCKNYYLQNTQSFDDYIQNLDCQIDPVLNFHHSHGAKIVGGVENYRERDTNNEGYGVLVEYDIYNRVKPVFDNNTTPSVSENLIEADDIRQFVLRECMAESHSKYVTEDEHLPLMEAGLDSADFLSLKRKIEAQFELKLNAGFFFVNNSLAKIVSELSLMINPKLGSQDEIKPQHQENKALLHSAKQKNNQISETDIAIVGISVKLPNGVETLEDCWRVFENEESTITEFPENRGIWPVDEATAKGGFVKDGDCFDAEFFRMSPSEAQITDPQQRILLELSWQCLENANIVPASLKNSKTGVFVGASNSDYSHLLVEQNIDVEAHTAAGNSLAVIANRLSYFFDLNGPSMLIDTACSSSLVALHTAVQSLRQGDCDSALVGAVNFICNPRISIAYQKAGMLAQDGLCKVFDQKADGYVRSEGAVVFMLKPAQKAVKDGNHIHGLIKGSAVNHGGLAAGLTVPNPGKQSELILSAWKNAQVDPGNIHYFEAHGTGTSLGDPIEIEGIQNAFSQGARLAAESTCGVGSAKSNFGHLESAAGAVGLVKLILAMNKGQIPATTHYSQLNPKIDLDGSHIYIQSESTPWEQQSERVSGVSSFGSGGANAHVVVQEYITDKADKETECLGVFVLSAINQSSLERNAKRIQLWIESGSSLPEYKNALYTWQTSRTAFKTRMALVAGNYEELNQQITQWLKNPSQAKFSQADLFDTDFDDANSALQAALKNRDVSLLAKCWLSGCDMPWKQLYKEPVKPCSIPHYAFAKVRHWIELNAETIEQHQAKTFSAQSEVLQPTWLECVNTEADRNSIASDIRLIVFGIGQAGHAAFQDHLGSNKIIFVETQDKDISNQYRHMSVALFNHIRDVYSKTLSSSYRLQIVAAGGSHEIALGLKGLLKTAQVENPLFQWQLSVFSTDIELETLAKKVNDDMARFANGAIIKNDDGNRFLRAWEPAKASTGTDCIWQENSDYLITGGLGTLGRLFANEILGKTRTSRVIVCGRSERNVNEALSGFLDPERVVYRQLDLIQLDNVKAVIGELEGNNYCLDGIIHCAGQVSDNYIIRKSEQEFLTVLQPKVFGTENLDLATQRLSLSHFFLFSSIMAETGNVGQSDYACANGFMDAFAERRNKLVLNGERSGHTTSFNWPLWQSGGMEVDESAEKLLWETAGMVAMPNEVGLTLFNSQVWRESSQALILYGDLDKIAHTVVGDQTPTTEYYAEDDTLTAEQVEAEVLQKLVELVAAQLKQKPENIDPQTQLTQYGVDSIFINKINIVLENVLGPVSKTLFFEYNTLADISAHLAEHYTSQCLSWVSEKSAAEIQPVQSTPLVRLSHRENSVSINNHAEPERIAIIGMSGIFPQADNVNEFWENLKQGKNCVTEIPSNRWDLDTFFNEDEHQAVAEGKSYCKYGAFVNEFAQFDPQFFGISPREANNIDPHERLFLQESWRALEDAGYSSNSLKEKYQRRVGVYVGVTKTEFELNGAYDPGATGKWYPRTSFSSIANRLSYFLDVTGPSMPIDTMCSSSFAAIHQACLQINTGECELAFAGGVNLYLHPSSYYYLSSQHMLSKEGLCRSFGEGGAGFVPGEGAAVVLLKPLSKAEADGDDIKGVILASSINHGGRTNGFTVPNPKSHAALIRDAHQRAGIDARDVTYIEAHGTGTALGDPIEVEGLHQAFSSSTSEKGFCRLGSAKSNIGHLEAAAGIAGLIKVLLQMKHKTIVPTLHVEKVNPNIRIEQTAFTLNRESSAWQTPVANGRVLPRIAGISSFGAGGVNTHLLVSEHQSAKTHSQLQAAEHCGPWLIPLSAKNTEQLQSRVRLLLNFIQQVLKNQQAYSQYTMENIAFTLQTGRDQMKQRALFYVNNLSELHHALESHLCASGNSYSLNEASPQARQIAEHWLSGKDYDWSSLYSESGHQRISLPTYPFAPEIHWKGRLGGAHTSAEYQKEHPLLHRNTSTLDRFGFTSNFRSNTAIASGSIAQGENQIAGINPFVFVDMAMAALEKSSPTSNPDNAVVFEEIKWSATPVDAQIDISIDIRSANSVSNGIEYQIYSQEKTSSEKVVNQARIAWAVASSKNTFDIKAIKENISRSNDTRYLDLQGYSVLSCASSTLFDFSDKTLVSENTLYKRLTSELIAYAAQFSFGDGHWCLSQASKALCHSNIERAVYCYVNVTGDRCVDLYLLDETGQACFSLTGLQFVSSYQPQLHTANESLFASPNWHNLSTHGNAAPVSPQVARYVFICDLASVKTGDIESSLPNTSCNLVEPEGNSIADKYESVALQCFERIQKLLLTQPTHSAFIQIVVAGTEEGRVYAGLTALLKTLSMEHAKCSGQVLITKSEPSIQFLLDNLETAKKYSTERLIDFSVEPPVYQQWGMLELARSELRSSYKDDGVYIITGGLGALGLMFAKNILEQTTYGCVVLTGRSPNREKIHSQLNRYFGNLVNRVTYSALDLASLNEVHRFIHNVQNDYQQINGLFHCAGMISDSLIKNKQSHQFSKTLTPKVTGTYNLDEATQNLGLDFFVVFSSIASATGNIGQCDYASANGFMDYFVQRRCQLTKQGKRKGASLSINWPYWKDGGMHIDHATQEMLLQSIGMGTLSTELGFDAFHRSLNLNISQSLVAEGKPEKLISVLRNTEQTASVSSQPAISLDQIKPRLKSVAAEVLEIESSKIDMQESLVDLGLDSILGTELVVAINKTFSTSLSSTGVYDYPNINALAKYVEENTRLSEQPVNSIEEFKSEENQVAEGLRLDRWSSSEVAPSATLKAKRASSEEKIAIVGMSGRYPKADNLSDYWQNLVDGKNTIVEIPDSRWDTAAYYDEDPDAEGKMYTKHLGVLEKADTFDPMFFRITPQEALYMDPEQRLFLQEGYKALEDAGYVSSEENGLNCGVYLGMEASEYYWHLAPSKRVSETITGNHTAIAAARLAYFLNLKGPALTIDTACSSSLVATHLARTALLNNETDMALAGGVRLWLSPVTHIGMCKARMLSPSGHCKTFDDSADGIVMGEGVGAVLLKRLSDAEQDGDNIYGVILASATNQDGKTNGITAPSIKSQIALERNLYENFNISPESISYVEAHGTGTKLGDPIELEALETVFKEKTSKKNYCALGSVKTNIGHTAAASGIASLHKVLLCMKHKTLVPTLNVEKENRHFDFDSSPFYISRKTKPWVAGDDAARRASISSFGFSGTNAHLVVEEYLAKSHVAAVQLEPGVFPLSAATEKQLVQKAEDLIQAIEIYKKQEATAQKSMQNSLPYSLPSLAYTLQVGRAAMTERTIFIANNEEELLDGLRGIVNGSREQATLICGSVDENDEIRNLFNDDEDLRFALDSWLKSKKLTKLSELWVKGVDIDWGKLYSEGHPPRMSLPTYPFAEDRFWVDRREHNENALVFHSVEAELHPLLHKNISDFERQAYQSVFTGKEYFLSDHKVKGQAILPGVAYLEMVLAALHNALALEGVQCRIEFKDHTWLQPLIVGQEEELTIECLDVAEDYEDEEVRVLEYAIYREAENDRILHCQGAVYCYENSSSEGELLECLDLDELAEEITEERLTRQEIYTQFANIGLEYGSAHQGIVELSKSEDDVLLTVELPEKVKQSAEQYYLHPSIMDAVMQGTICFLDGFSRGEAEAAMPFTFESMTVYAKPEPRMIAWITTSEEFSTQNLSQLNIALCNEQGEICVTIEGFVSRKVTNKSRANVEAVVQEETIDSELRNPEVNNPELNSLMPIWNPIYQQNFLPAIDGNQSPLLIGGSAVQFDWLKTSFKHARHLPLDDNISIEDLSEKIATLEFDHLVWVAPEITHGKSDPAAIIESQKGGVLPLFRLVKCLTQLGYQDNELKLTIITSNALDVIEGGAITPHHAGVHGLIGSATKELPLWHIQLVDVETLQSTSALEIFRLPRDEQGNGVVKRQGEWFKPEFAKLTTLKESEPVYKNNGVYVVIGGAGGLGEVWTRYMVQHYQANVIWIGRKPLNEEINHKLKEIASYGKKPRYISADATDFDSLNSAVKEIRKQYPGINGVVHSALVLRDSSIQVMEENVFKQSLAAKVDVSVNMERAFADIPLDFMLFFSSISSFHRGAGQSNYCAGCTFKDAFARSIRSNRLYPIKVVNWGYWGSVGIVKDAFYQKRMERMGYGSIEPDEAMDALQHFVASDLNQIAFVKTISSVALDDLDVSEEISYQSKTTAPA